MIQIPNAQEISRLVETINPSEEHQSLVETLHRQYPDFMRVALRRGWSRIDKGLANSDGKIISPSFPEWITREYEAAGKDARKVYEKHKDKGLVLTEWRGETIYFTWAFGPRAADFYQLEIDYEQEETDREAFDIFPPEDLYDLLNPFSHGVDKKVVSPGRYRLEKLTNIRTFVKEMGELKKNEQNRRGFVPENRFLQDWEESSLGQEGHILCHHWFLELRDYTDPKKERHMSFIPQWADAAGGEKRLPRITADDFRSAYGLMEALENFDSMVGLTFGWYPYMLHGNRIDHTVGHTIAAAIREKRICLPERDSKVLLRWDERSYGF